MALITLQRIADLWSIGALLMLVLIVPHFTVCLFIYERDPRIKYARQHRDSGYYYSLRSWSSYMRLAAIGMLVLITLYLIRVFNHYDVVGESLTPQPGWSYLLSMIATTILVLILWAPSFYLLWIKYEARHDRRIERLATQRPPRRA